MKLSKPTKRIEKNQRYCKKCKYCEEWSITGGEYICFYNGKKFVKDNIKGDHFIRVGIHPDCQDHPNKTGNCKVFEKKSIFAEILGNFSCDYKKTEIKWHDE